MGFVGYCFAVSLLVIASFMAIAKHDHD